MIVLVIGATGSIGRLVVEQLHKQGDIPRAFSRDEAKARRLLGADTEIVTGDLTDEDSLKAAVADVDAIVMTHGAPYGSSGYEAVDYGAVPAVLTALDGRQVQIALMSSIGVTGGGQEVLIWKHRGERLLRASGQPYTIVRPGWFDAGSGKEGRVDLRQGDKTEYGPVRREHVAQTLVHALHADSALRRTVEVFSTDGPAIEDWEAAFAATTEDARNALDGALDRPGPPIDREPQSVRSDLQRLGH